MAGSSSTEIRFYHLQRQKIDQALPGLLRKALGGDFRILVHGRDMKQVQALDRHLWTAQPEDFLPHGAGETSDKDPHAARQPIWISPQKEAPNQANLLIELDGLEIDQDQIGRYDLICFMFEDWDTDRVQEARKSWKSLKNLGIYKLSYWQQNDNAGWECAEG